MHKLIVSIPDMHARVEAVDAFTVDWCNEKKNWVSTTISVTSTQNAEKCKAHGTLVVPRWASPLLAFVVHPWLVSYPVVPRGCSINMLCHRKRDVIGVTATLICYRSYYSIHARLEIWIAANYYDMVDIVDELHKYIPKTTSVQTFQVNTEGGGSEVVTYHILIGGDQLTAAVMAKVFSQTQ